MGTFTSIEPRKSKRTGNIPFTVTGTGFSTTDLSNDFSGPAFYTDISINNGTISDLDSLLLTVDATPGSVAGVDTTHLFSKAFDVSTLISYELNSLPAIDGSKISALRAFDTLDNTTYFDLYLGYMDGRGYILKTEVFISGVAKYSKTMSIDPSRVQGLKIIRSGDRFSGYAKISNKFAEVGTYSGFSLFDSQIKLYASNSPISFSGNFSVSIDSYNVETIVSLVNKPATISTVLDTEIKGLTQQNELGTGDILIGLKDGTVIESIGSFEYTERQGVNRDTKNFDMVISVFNFHIKPSRNELFSSADSFKWDENYWIRPDKQNKNLFIPSLWDPTTANIPSDFLQSGYGDNSNIKLLDIGKVKAESQESWHAKINHGTYFIKNVPYYLYSSESITLQLGPNLTGDGRSKQNLTFLPKPGVPISASTLSTDIESGLIIDKKRFKKRGKFTGLVKNGVELNTDVVSNIDKSQTEFIVKYNSNNIVKNWKIPLGSNSAGLYSFELPKVPLKDYPVIFTRKDIFSNEKSIGHFYGDSGTIYGQSYYGLPLDTPGDYAIDYQSGTVQVVLDQKYIDLGYVTFTSDYPAIIEFNDNYLGNIGGDILSPTPSDINNLDVLGTSTGEPGQILKLKEFPVLDFSDSQFLDSENFHLFVFDESDNTFETDWVRVRNIKEHGPGDKVYQLNPDQGTVFFGDNINGAIPTKYKKIVAGYKISVRIEYEPVSSVDYWIGRDTDLNLSKNNLSSGFLYLSRKELIPDTISIEFSTNAITALDFAELSAVVRDADGDPIPGVDLVFDIVNGNGNLEEKNFVTDSNGRAKTIFIPSGDIRYMGIFAHAYSQGILPTTLGDPNLGMYSSSGELLNNMIIAEESIEDAPGDVYLFKIYDNEDPFAEYNNQSRTGGTYQVLHYFNTVTNKNEVLKPTAINGKVLIFDQSLPQPFDISEPNYEPNLRGFAIIGSKQVQAKASVDTGLVTIDSDIAKIGIKYSSIQKGEWTLPILPTTFTGSEISRATYLTINP